MYYIASIMGTDDTDSAVATWERLASDLRAQQAGQELQIDLLQVVEQAKPDTPVDYQLVSIVRSSDDIYDSIKNLPMFSTTESYQAKAVCACTEKFAENEIDLRTGGILLFSPFFIETSQMDEWFGHWMGAHRIVSKKSGFVGVRFLETSDKTSSIKFINMAQWESKQHIASAITKEEYQAHLAIAKRYRMMPALCKWVRSA